MSEAQAVKRADDPLHLDDGGLELPAEYRYYEPKIVVRTPGMTLQVASGSLESPLGVVLPRHFGDGDHNPNLAPDTVSLKKYGEGAEVFRVDV